MHDSEGNSSGAIGVLRDITDVQATPSVERQQLCSGGCRRSTDKLQLQAEQLREANQELQTQAAELEEQKGGATAPGGIRPGRRARAPWPSPLGSIADGVIATDAQGRVVLMNLAAEQLTGWPAAESARGKPLPMVFALINRAYRATGRGLGQEGA